MKSILATFFFLSFCLGTGWLLIPFGINLVGFWPSIAALIIAWVFLLLTSLCYLEAVLAAPPGANVFSISQSYIGKGWAWFSSSIFIVINYTTISALFLVGSPVISEMLFRNGIYVPSQLVPFLLCLILFVIAFFGITLTVFFNLLLTFAMGVFFYFCFTTHLVGSVPAFKELKWGLLFIVFPSIINNYYCHTLIPTVASFLNYDRKRLQVSIFTGFSIGMLFIIFWLWLMFMSIPQLNLQEFSKIDLNATAYSSLIQTPFFGKWLPILLVLSTLATSLGLSVVLVDFFSDIFHLPMSERKGLKRVLMCTLALLPPLLPAFAPTNTIYVVITFIADIGTPYLIGILPILWTWSLRYFHQEKGMPIIPGGKKMLSLLGILSALIFYFTGLEFIYQSTL